MRLHIVTPCSRPENIPAIRESILSQFPNWDSYEKGINWLIIFDDSLDRESPEMENAKSCIRDNFNFSYTYSGIKNSFVGHSHRNFALDYLIEEKMETGFVYFLDDDTVLHPDFVKHIFSEADSEKSAVIFNQAMPDGMTKRLDASLDHVKVCEIDMGMYMVNLRDILPQERFEISEYCGDGIFIESFFERVGRKSFQHIDRTLSIYNKLRP